MGKKHKFYEKGKKRRRDDLPPDDEEGLELDGVPKASTENVEVRFLNLLVYVCSHRVPISIVVIFIKFLCHSFFLQIS